ncbi:MAG: right-handed parallel beta-helix repeat-containing protein [Gemmataceae bacterium]
MAGGLAAIYNDGGLLTVTNCSFSDNLAESSDAYGGAIFSTGGSLTVTSCAFSDNRVIGQPGLSGGGAIYTSGGPLTVTNCTFTGNTSSREGGAISKRGPGTALISDSTFSGNSSDWYGGGIAVLGPMALTNCTFTGNYAQVNGGGLFSYSAIALSNCTFTNNESGWLGGAIGGRNLTTLTNCTVVGNSSNQGSISGDQAPGWVGSLKMSNTIVAESYYYGTATRMSDIYLPTTVISLGHNLIGIADGSSGWLASDRTGTTASPLDPLVGPLRDNGGPTQTIAPLPGSPAIDAGDDTNGGLPVPATDQRGRTRIAGAAIDIGAFEVHPSVFQADVDAIWAGTAGSTTITQAVDQGNITDYLNAVADLTPNPAAATPATIVLTSAGGVTPGQTVRVPAGVILVLDGVTFVGASPALTVALGTVIVRNSTLTNATDAPTVRLLGGSLTLRNTVVQESPGYDQVAIRVEGGTLDLGTPADPGRNVINVNGAGQLLVNTTLYPVTMFGDTWQENGATLAGGLLVTRGKAAGIGFWQGPNGRALINALGTTPTGASRVGAWLAASYPNLYGSLSGGTPDGVWSHFRSLFKVTGTPKLETQVMATALSAYVTDTTLNTTSLGKSTAQRYGFVLGGGSLASEVTFAGGGQASSLGRAGGAGYYTVAQLLAAADSQASGGWLFSASADRTKRREANDLFAAINDTGGV